MAQCFCHFFMQEVVKCLGIVQLYSGRHLCSTSHFVFTRVLIHRTHSNNTIIIVTSAVISWVVNVMVKIKKIKKKMCVMLYYNY